jgi:hypothetical protein
VTDDDSHESVGAVLMLATELVTGPLGRDRACKFVAALAREQGLTVDDHPIDSRQISRWLWQLHREDIPTDTLARYHQLRRQVLPGDPTHTFSDLLVQSRRDKRLHPHCMALAKGLLKLCHHVAAQGLAPPV